MKKRFLLTLTALLTIGSMAMADIQSPPGGQFNWSRKLSRAIANLAYAPFEIPSYAMRSLRSEGNVGSNVIAPIEGLKRTAVRIGYGVFEVVTFPVPAYKAPSRPPYYRKQRIAPWFGYDEFPPQFGIAAQSTYSRTQSW